MCVIIVLPIRRVDITLLRHTHIILVRQDNTPQTGDMDQNERRWWRLLDELPGSLRNISIWPTPQPRPPRGAGHMHPNPTLMACLTGVVRVRCCSSKKDAKEDTLDLQPGDVVLIAAGVWHHQENLHGESVTFGQGFIGTWSDVCLRDANSSWSGKLPSNPSRLLMDAALSAKTADERRSHTDALLKQVLAESVDHLAFAEESMQRMVNLLWARFHTGLTVTELLKASGLSRSRAYAVFTAGYGASPKEALETMRLWLAGSLLQSGIPVTETALRAGFGTPGTFTRAWRRAHGKPPAVFLTAVQAAAAARRALPTTD